MRGYLFPSSLHPKTDGEGYSLVIEDESIPWNEWGTESSWRISDLLGGSAAKRPTELAEWMAAYFTPGELQDESVSGDHTDLDGDGRSTLKEFISGTDPRDASSVLVVESLSR